MQDRLKRLFIENLGSSDTTKRVQQLETLTGRMDPNIHTSLAQTIVDNLVEL